MNTKSLMAPKSFHLLNHGLRALNWAGMITCLLPALIFFSECAVTSAQQAIKTGPGVGSILPSFEAPDQNGRLQNLKSILGPKGALLVFYRSADW